MRKLLTALGSPAIAVDLWDGTVVTSGELVPMSGAGIDDLRPEAWLTSDAGRAAAERTWREGVPLVFSDVAELRSSLGTHAAMLVPVSSRDGRLGLLALGIDEVSKADAAQAEAGTVGELIALAFERATKWHTMHPKLA